MPESIPRSPYSRSAPDTVAAFYADRTCSIRSNANRKTLGYTYRWIQRPHPNQPIGGFTNDDLVAFVTQRGWTDPLGVVDSAQLLPHRPRSRRADRPRLPVQHDLRRTLAGVLDARDAPIQNIRAVLATTRLPPPDLPRRDPLWANRTIASFVIVTPG